MALDRRIFGLETEFGITDEKYQRWRDMDDLMRRFCNAFDSSRIRNACDFIENGGRFYMDGGHPEYASPETTNPVDAVIFI